MKTETKNAVKHTPGPWRIVQRDEQGAFNGRRITIEGGPGMIADLDWNTPEQNLANARLIASAPDLMEVCKELLGAASGTAMRVLAAQEKAKSAIAKATGETI